MTITAEARVAHFVAAARETSGAALRMAERFARMRDAANVANLAIQRQVRARKVGLEVAQAGMEARWYVRGALDPAYASEAARDAQVKFLASHAAAYHGTDLALSFLRGWVDHHPQAAEPVLSWHRQIGATQVTVTRAAS